jgi:hypothetical protein
MTEGSVPHVMTKAYRFNKVFVQTKSPCNRPRNLSYLKTVSHARPIMVARHDVDLCLMLEASEGFRMQNAVTVSLIRRPERAKVIRPFSFSLTAFRRLRRKDFIFQFFCTFPYAAHQNRSFRFQLIFLFD